MAQSTEISGDYNQGYIAGRDLYLGDQYVVQETLYFEPDLADVELSVWTTTPKAEELARALAKNRLVILAGQDLDDKTMVARHLAWLLRQGLPGEVRVREWYRSSDPQKIETAFHETDTTILLLPQILPHHVGHRLHELSRLLHARRNYTIITTDGTRAEWGIQSGSPEEAVWQEISWESYYGRPFLTEVLLRELGSLNGQRPEWLPEEIRYDTQLVPGLTIEEAAARLKQPARIQHFVEWLQNEEASPRTVLPRLDQLGGDRSAIRHWFEQLDRMDQLLALGLVLFDGLPDDQIFAAVEYLVDGAWRRTDPNLPLFDYRDLTRLSAYFRLTDAGEDGARIETPSQRKRKAILQAAWESQRRRLLAVVPAMTRLVKHLSPKTLEKEAVKDEVSFWKRPIGKASPRENKRKGAGAQEAAGKPTKKEAREQDDADAWRFTQGSERELFSSPRRVEQLQRSVIESLSQIGLLSFEAVEASFLDLAVEGTAEVQKVVAKALAAWRGEGHHAKLFKVLHAWWEAGSRTTPPKTLEQREGQAADLLASIRATVVLAAGYALQYDPPDRLAPELVGLLNVAFTDVHPAVYQRLMELTLPLAAASHPWQLESTLRDRLSRDDQQMYAIAFGIGMGFSLNPAGALRVIEGWQLLALSQEPRPPGDRTITPRERLLAAVSLAYGYLRCKPGEGALTPQQVVVALHAIFTAESHTYVRTHAIMAMGLQGLNNFEVVAPMLMELVADVALADRSTVVSVFVRAYLKQRELLTGGDGEIGIDGVTYQVWTRSQRPVTAIETSLYTWLRNEEHPVARQVAAQTFAAFGDTELERRERNLSNLQEKGPREAPRPSLGLASDPRRLRRLNPWGYFAVLCAAPLKKPIRALIQPVIAEVIELENAPKARSATRANRPAGEDFGGMILKKWHADGDPEVRKFARAAARAFNVFRWRWMIVTTAIFCSVVYVDWRDWQWSRQEPLAADEAITLAQRRALPLRLARNRWLGEFDAIVREKTPVVVEASGQPKPVAREEPVRKPEPVDRKEPEAQEPPKKVPSGPMQQLRWSALVTVPRVGLSKPSDEKERYLQFLRVLPVLLAEDKPEKVAVEDKPAPAPPAAPPAVPPSQSSAATQARPSSMPASKQTVKPKREERKPSPAPESAPARVPTLSEPSPQLSVPAQDRKTNRPKWINKLRFFRKKPPKGENDGNG